VPANGGEPVRLTRDEDSAGYAIWSRDGRRLALEFEESGDTHIYVVDRDGGGRRRLTTGKGQNWPHSWGPDNDRIAFAGERDGIWNLWTVSATTGNAQRLTAFTGPNAYVRYPAWSPLNDRIVFERAVTTANLWTGRLRSAAAR
jgi:Tol biopolymer transport system component